MVIASDWWAGSRVTAPPQIEFISTEERKASVGLSAAVVAGETIQGGTLVASVRRYRDGLVLDPTPLILPLSYDTGTKIAAAEIDADKLPQYESAVLILTFDVTGSFGTEQRSSYTILWRVL